MTISAEKKNSNKTKIIILSTAIFVLLAINIFLAIGLIRPVNTYAEKPAVIDNNSQPVVAIQNSIVQATYKTKEAKYIAAKSYMKKGELKKALALFKSLGTYKDSDFYEHYINSPKVYYSKKVIRTVNGKKRIVFTALKGNHYKLKTGSYLGEYKKMIINGKTSYNLIMRPSKVVAWGSGSRRALAMTFDDSGENLGKILKILDKRKVKGTFFLLARELKNNPARWRNAVKNGHLVCNHSVSHDFGIINYSEQKMKNEIKGWENVAKKVLGINYIRRMRREFPYFRSPGGASGRRLQQVLGNLGYPRTIYWSCENAYFRYHNPRGISIAQHYTENAYRGAIFLFHGGDYVYLNQIITNVKNRNFAIKLLPDIMV